MIVGIDMRPVFFTRGGIARYLVCLTNALARVSTEDRFLLFCPRSLPDDIDIRTGGNLRANVLRFPLRWRSLEVFWANLLLPGGARLGRADLVHFPRFEAPRLRTGRTVVTVHDLAFRHHPETLTERSRRHFESATAKAVCRADAVIAVSEQTRQDILDAYRLPPERVRVVYNGVEPRFHPGGAERDRERICRAYGVREGFILFVGTLEPRKNVVGLLKAYALLRGTHPDAPPLVVAGGKGWLFDEIFRTVEDLKLQPLVRFTGHVPDADLPDLYRCARIFAFPSFYEGFGLPVLEAMACGVPVVTSRLPPFVEIAGDAALLTDPNDPEAIASALGGLLSDEALAGDFRRRGIARAACFSWDRAALETLSVYRDCLS